MRRVRKYLGLRFLYGTLLFSFFFSFNCMALDSFKISTVRPSKAFACSSVIGDARRKAIDLCKKQGGKKVNYDTYEVPIVCEWEELPGKDKRNPSFRATIVVRYECRGEMD